MLYTYIAGTHESSWGCAQICITRTVIWLTHIRRKSQRTIPRKKSRRLYNNNPPWLPHHHRFPPPKKKRETLTIMGSQVTGGFGHPRSQFSLRKKKYQSRVQWFLGNRNYSFFGRESHQLSLVAIQRFHPPMLRSWAWGSDLARMSRWKLGSKVRISGWNNPKEYPIYN